MSLWGFGEPTGKEKKRATLDENVRRGKAAEDQFVWQNQLMGNEVTRTGRGSDYRVRRRNILTGKVESSELVEVKSSYTAPKSPLQRKTRARKEVVEPLFY